ncbi:unnamed protein product, partial [Amoebophrya sp. A120]
ALQHGNTSFRGCFAQYLLDRVFACEGNLRWFDSKFDMDAFLGGHRPGVCG